MDFRIAENAIKFPSARVERNQVFIFIFYLVFWLIRKDYLS